MEHEVVEPRAALVVEAHDLPVEDRAGGLQVSCDALAEIGEPPIDVVFPGDELAMAVVDVGQLSEPVELHLVEEVGIVERGVMEIWRSISVAWHR